MNRRVLTGFVFAAVCAFGLTAKAAGWETDFAKASTNASKSGAYMLLDFSGSDWCGWCIKLEKEVFSKPAFKKYADANLVCILVDFPRSKKQEPEIKRQNAELAKKYDVKGFPTVVILSPEGEVAGITGYQEGGDEKYVEHLKQIIDKHKAQKQKK